MADFPESTKAPSWTKAGNLLTRSEWWALQDSNLQPTDYESAALTIELRALCLFLSVSALPASCREFCALRSGNRR